jgi:hypothetical protein
MSSPQPESRAGDHRRETLVVAAILAVATGFRVREAMRSPLWFDELFTLWMSRHPLPRMMELLRGDIHPPLPSLIVAAWRAVGGESTLWLKILPLTFGVLTILMAYGFARDLFGRSTGWVAALLLAVHASHIYISQELRPYSQLAFALVVAAWGAWRWMHSGRSRDAVLWAAGMAFSIHTHYLGVLVVGFLDLWVLVAIGRDRSRRRDALLVHIVVLASVLPLAGMLPAQLALARAHWLPPTNLAEFVDLLRHLSFSATYLIPIGVVLLAAAWRVREQRAAAAFVTWLVLVPAIAAFVLTRLGAHLFSVRHWLILAPLWCVGLAAGLMSLPGRRTRNAASALLVAVAARTVLATPPLREATALRDVASILAPRLAPGDLLFCVDPHSLITLDHHLGVERGIVMTMPTGLSDALDDAFIPSVRRVDPDSLRRAVLAGRRWWAVRTRESGGATIPIATMIDSLARDHRLEIEPVTVWASGSGMLEGAAPTRRGGRSLAAFALRSFHAGDVRDPPQRRFARRVDLRLGTRQVEASVRAEQLRVDQLHACGLERLVARERDVSGRLGLEDQQRLARQQHVAVAGLVDELRVVRLDRADHLVGDDPRLEAVVLLELQVVEHRLAADLDLALVEVVDLEQAERALDHHDRGRAAGRLERHVHHPVDDQAGGGLDEQRRHARHRQEAARGGADEGGELGLEIVEEDVGAEGHVGHGRGTITAAFPSVNDALPLRR